MSRGDQNDQFIGLSPAALRGLSESLAAQASRAMQSTSPSKTQWNKDAIRLRTGKITVKHFGWMHTVELGKSVFDPDGPGSSESTFETYDRPDDVKAYGLEKWLFEVDERVILALMAGRWFVLSGQKRMWLYQLRDPASAETDAHIMNMDQVIVTTPQTVYDPLGIIDDQKAGDKGYCYLQDGKFWALQAPC